MSGGLVDAMLAGYGQPRRAMARQRAGGVNEAQALFHLFAACGLGFVASLPTAVRRAADLAIADPLSATVAAHAFGYLVLAPLLLYGAAAVLHLVARAFGGRGSFAGARAALFWALLLGGPIALVLAAAAALLPAAFGPAAEPWLAGLGVAGLGFWLWLLAASLAEAEGFVAAGRVAAVVFAGFAAIAAALSLAAG